MKYQAIIINHPEEVFDSIEGRFECAKKMASNTLFFLRRKPTLILVHSSEKSDNLIPVKGTMQLDVRGIRRNTVKHKVTRDWYALTIGAVEHIDERIFDNKKALMKEITEGDFWDNPVNMGPYTLGSNLELPEVKRQMFKQKLDKVADRLDASIKWMIPVMIAALLLIILTRSTG